MCGRSEVLKAVQHVQEEGKIQADSWGFARISSSAVSIEHLDQSWSLNAGNVNGWLRNFLWSQAAQVINSYGSSSAAYGLIFLLAHFVWALSLMFLFSGRGYWQELIESIV